MYYHHIHNPQYRCSTCGRRCGANGHAGCGNAELINDLPAVLIPFMVWFIHFILGFVAIPVGLMLGWTAMPSIWAGLGWFWVAVCAVVVILAKVGGKSGEDKHKRDEIDAIIADGMRTGKTADVIAREIRDGK